MIKFYSNVINICLDSNVKIKEKMENNLTLILYLLEK